MSEEKNEFQQLLAELRSLRPPRGRRSNTPKHRAEEAVYRMAHGEGVELTGAMWQKLPAPLKIFDLRETPTGKNSAIFGLKPTYNAVSSALGYLKSNGWRPFTATCKPTTRGRGKNGR